MLRVRILLRIQVLPLFCIAIFLSLQSRLTTSSNPKGNDLLDMGMHIDTLAKAVSLVKINPERLRRQFQGRHSELASAGAFGEVRLPPHIIGHVENTRSFQEHFLCKIYLRNLQTRRAFSGHLPHHCIRKVSGKHEGGQLPQQRDSGGYPC